MRAFESFVSADGAARRANLSRLRELARLTIGYVKLFCSHDLVEFAALKGEEEFQASISEEEREAETPPWRPQYGTLRAAE